MRDEEQHDGCATLKFTFAVQPPYNLLINFVAVGTFDLLTTLIHHGRSSRATTTTTPARSHVPTDGATDLHNLRRNLMEPTLKDSREDLIGFHFCISIFFAAHGDRIRKQAVNEGSTERFRLPITITSFSIN